MIGFLRFLSLGGLILTAFLAGVGASGNEALLVGYELVFLLLALIFGFMIIFTWTPLLGEIVCRPITQAIEGDPDVEEMTFLLFIANALLKRKQRRLGVLFCFWEAMIHPGWPTPFYAAMKHSKPDSWQELWFAERVWTGRNAHFCLEARQTLERHGVDPGKHREPEIARLLASWDRETSTERREPVQMKKHVNRPPVRDDRITLFETGETVGPCRVPATPPTAPMNVIGKNEKSVVTDGKSADHDEQKKKAATVDLRAEPLEALLERDGGVQIQFPTPGAVVQWLRESFANSLIRSVDASAPKGDKQPARKTKRRD
jgi:hypothetical protein